MTFYLVPCLKTCRLASLLVRRGLWFQNVCLQMHPSSCAGSVVSFKTQWISSLVNLAHVYPVSGVVAERVASQTMLPCLTTCRLAMLVRRGLWLHQRRMNLPLQLPAGVYLLSFKTRMPILFRLAAMLVLRASTVNLAQIPPPCLPAVLFSSAAASSSALSHFTCSFMLRRLLQQLGIECVFDISPRRDQIHVN